MSIIDAVFQVYIFLQFIKVELTLSTVYLSYTCLFTVLNVYRRRGYVTVQLPTTVLTWFFKYSSLQCTGMQLIVI